MTLLGLLVLLIVVGVLLYLLNTYVPMAQPIKTIVNVVMVLVVILLVLQWFGLLDALSVRRTR